MEGKDAVLQRHLLGLAQPVGQERQGRAVVRLAQERVHNQGERLGGVKIIQVAAPEGQVGAGLAAAVPVGQG